MKKKIQWVIINGDGTYLWGDPDVEDAYCRSREQARATIKSIHQQIFEPWYAHVQLPLKIMRREWKVVEEKIVR